MEWRRINYTAYTIYTYVYIFDWALLYKKKCVPKRTLHHFPSLYCLYRVYHQYSNFLRVYYNIVWVLEIIRLSDKIYINYLRITHIYTIFWIFVWLSKSFYFLLCAKVYHNCNKDWATCNSPQPSLFIEPGLSFDIFQVEDCILKKLSTIKHSEINFDTYCRCSYKI